MEHCCDNAAVFPLDIFGFYYERIGIFFRITHWEKIFAYVIPQSYNNNKIFLLYLCVSEVANVDFNGIRGCLEPGWCFCIINRMPFGRYLAWW